MDTNKLIRQLLEEKRRLDLVISHLEALDTGTRNAGQVAPRRVRGRKQMSAEERQEVSARMKTYWAKRREQNHVSRTSSAGA